MLHHTMTKNRDPVPNLKPSISSWHFRNVLVNSCNHEDVTVTEFQFDPKDKDTLARLRKMPIFDAMDIKQLPKVLKFARLREYNTGETIIEEGDTDQLVYFLILGSCTVEVEGLEINTLSTLGDVFGEMGIVDQKPRSATIKAESPVLCMVLDGSFIEQLEGIDKLAAQALFYRIFAEMLAARIRDANGRILILEDQLEDLSIHPPSF